MNDPNSSESKFFQTLAIQNKMIPAGPDGKPLVSVSGATLSKSLPLMQQAVELQRNQQGLDQQREKEWGELASKIADPSTRSAMGRNQLVVDKSKAIQTLVKANAPNGDYDKLTKQQVEEVVKSLDAMLSQGASTVSGSEALRPNSWYANGQNLIQVASNEPTGAGLGKFVKQMVDTVDREQDVAHKNQDTIINAYRTGHQRLFQSNPERFNTMVGGVGSSAAPVGNAPTVSAQDKSAALEWIRNNPNDPRASQIKARLGM